jgi:hypothetical protein
MLDWMHDNTGKVLLATMLALVLAVSVAAESIKATIDKMDIEQQRRTACEKQNGIYIGRVCRDPADIIKPVKGGD